MNEASPLRRILKNAGALIGGKGFAGVLSLIYLGLAARALGPSDMGVLVLAQAFAMTVVGIARFQSWQAIIRFGAPLVAKNEVEAFRALARFTIRLDVASAVIATAVGLIAAPYVARKLGWSGDVLRLVQVYAFAIPFLMGATATGVLRLFDRFRLLGLQLAVLPFVRLVGSVILAMTGAGVEAFIAVWILSAVANGVSIWALGWRELKARGLAPRLLGEDHGAHDPLWMPFVIKTNLSSTVDLANESLPVLIVGGLLGPSAAGFFQIAINVTNVLSHGANMLNHATYPELARVDAADGRQAMLKLAAKSAGAAMLVAAPLVITMALFGEPIAKLVAGPAFAPAGILVALMALYQPFRIPTIVLESATVARGKAGGALLAQALGAATLIGSLFAFAPAFGVVTAPFAMLAGRLVMIATLAVFALYD